MKGASFELWPGGAPLALGSADQDRPTLTVFPAKEPNGQAMIICPGGGYWMLADHEGAGYAKYLSLHGVTCFVLKYRLGQHKYRHPAMWMDASRAMRTVLARAAEFGVDSKRIGIMGSSAGGHLASTLLTHWDMGDPASKDPIERVSSRPDFGALCYPVISMSSFGHLGSRANLLGENPSDEAIYWLSNELHVTATTPPCFLWHTAEDDGVPAQNMWEFGAALMKAGVGCQMLQLPYGRHGLGLGEKEGQGEVLSWGPMLVTWLASLKREYRI